MIIKEKKRGKSPKLSIIIPVYNTEPYLRECLDSVVNQTYKDIEIIIINDCSPDNSEEIILEYQQNDPRIKYIKHEVNKGTHHARETGAYNSLGEYLLYIDPDDFIDLQLCEKLIPLIDQHPDCIIYNIVSFPFDQARVSWYNRNQRNFTQKHEFFNALIRDHIHLGAVIQKVYKREIIIQVFQELNIQERYIITEDVLLNICTAYYCTTVLHLDYYGYYYRINLNSITRRTYDLECSLFHLDQTKICFNYFYLFLQNHNLSSNTADVLVNYLLYYYFGLSNNIQYINILAPKIISTFGEKFVISHFLEKIQSLQKQTLLLQQSSKTQHNQTIQYDKWYKFGQLSRKHKIKKIIVVLSKKLHIYPFLKKIFLIVRGV